MYVLQHRTHQFYRLQHPHNNHLAIPDKQQKSCFCRRGPRMAGSAPSISVTGCQHRVAKRRGQAGGSHRTQPRNGGNVGPGAGAAARRGAKGEREGVAQQPAGGCGTAMRPGRRRCATLRPGAAAPPERGGCGGCSAAGRAGPRGPGPTGALAPRSSFCCALRGVRLAAVLRAKPSASASRPHGCVLGRKWRLRNHRNGLRELRAGKLLRDLRI